MTIAGVPIRIRASHLVILFATFLFTALLMGAAHAGDTASAVGSIAATAAEAVSPPAKAAVAPGLFLGVAAAIGLALRVVIVPLLRTFGAFSGLPLPVQHLIIGAISALAGGLTAYGANGEFVDAVIAGITVYGSSQAAYGLTAPLFEQKKP